MRETRKLVAIAALACLVLANAGLTHAQTVMGTILGTVKDSHGAVIAGAAVTVKSVETGIERTATSSDQGEYYVPNVPVGRYQVTGSKSGFKTEVRSGVTVTVGASVAVNLDLDVGDIQEQVQVTSDSAQIETTTSSMGGLVSDQVIRELPLNGRDWLQLATLQPGVVYVAGQNNGTSKVQRGNGLELSIGGGRPVENLYRIDGIAVNDFANAGPGSSLGVNLGVDAVQEFSVLTSAYSAEYGRSGGGVVNAVLKSGTNGFHGTVFEFLRNSALDARNFFDGRTVPPFRRNNFGGSIGGPIQQNRTFFFANHEGLREFQSLSTQSNTLTDAARAGNLSSGHVAINAKILPYLPLFPRPNGAITPPGDTGKYISSGGLTGHENYVVGKLDHVFTDKTTMNGSYSLDNTTTTTPDAFNERLIAANSRRQNVALSLQHSFSANVLNTTRAGVSRTFADNGVDLVAGANPLLLDPTLGFFPGDNMGTFSITGLTSPGGVGSSQFNLFGYTSTQFTDDLYWTKGRHNLKFGAYVERIDSNSNRASSPTGNWTFGSIKNFLTLVPQQFAGPLPGTDFDRGMRQTVFAGYFQDDFRIRQNLTLNLGLRYEMSTVLKEVNGKESNLHNLTDPGVTIGEPLYNNPTLRDFEPRIGFAWDPRGDGKMAIRGGVGIFDVLVLPYTLQNFIDRAQPFQISASITNPPAAAFPNQVVSLIKPSSGITTLVEFNPHRAYATQYNLNVERQLAKDLALQVGYTGATGVHLPIKFDDIDVVPLSLTTRTASGQYQFPTTGTPQRINPAFGRIGAILFGGHSTYNALLVNLTKRFSHNLTFQVAYRWARSIDNGDSTFSASQNTNSVANPYPLDMSLNRGPADYDVPHNLFINYTWIIPTPSLWNAVEKTLLAGWQVGGIFEAQSGAPFSLTIPNDQARTGTSAVGSSTPSGERPNLVQGPGCGNPVAGNPGNYINLSCFSFPALGTIGNLGRNTLRVPKIVNFDFSLFKNFNVIGERLKAQFRAEAFNLFNHPSFQPQIIQAFTSSGAPVATAAALPSPTVTSARQLQFGLKLIF